MSEHRLTELLADHTIFGLDSADEREFNELFDSTSNEDLESFELAAAVVDLSMLKPDQMPETLERMLKRQGREVIAEDPETGRLFDSGSEHDDFGLETEPEHPGRAPIVRSEERLSATDENQRSDSASNTKRIREIFAWGCAAAIGFVALMVWNNNRETVNSLNDRISQLEKDKVAASEKLEESKLNVAQLSTLNKLLAEQKDAIEKKYNPVGSELYEKLVNSNDDVIRWNWGPSKENENQVKGEVVWNGKTQEGVMKLENLEQNDPAMNQYQLWIVEAANPNRKRPVDGGVFDVESGEAVYIPINAKLFAKTPSAFAITVEVPGGVVKSEQPEFRLVATGPKTEQ